MTDLISELKEYDRLYFESGDSPITDTEYDKLKTEAKRKSPNNPYFNQVGYEFKTEYKKIKLPFVMGGLDKTDNDSLGNWINGQNRTIIVSEKLDGNSILCTWENGKLIFAASRGDENEGQDILEKGNFFIPKISKPGKVSLRGEVVLENDLCKHFGFKNRRNGVTGLLRRDDVKSNDLKLLSVIFYEVVESPEKLFTEVERLEYISKLNLRLPRFFNISSSSPNLLDILPKSLLEFKLSAPYDIDGLVLTFNDSERENVKHPKNKVKFKVNEAAVSCVVRGIEWNVTRTSLIKPVILIEPTEIMGVTVSRVSGFNAEFMEINGIDKGAVVGIVRSGDVIPYVTEYYGRCESVNIPKVCPTCSGATEIKSKELMCTNPECFYKNVYKVAHFFTSLDVENISDKTIEKIGVTTVQEMYLLTEGYLKIFDGFGERKAEIVISEIKKTLKTKPWKLLAAFGMPMIGRTLSKQLCSKYTMDELFEIKDPEVLELGPITSKSFVDNIQSHKELYDFLKSIGLEFEEEDVDLKTLKGIKFTLTGEGPMKRSELQKLIEAKGGEVKGISKDTHYLVTNDPDSNSGKTKGAIKFGVPIIDYDRLMSMVEGVK